MIANELVVFKKIFVDKIFVNYFYVMEPYLGYQFNDKNLKDEANLVKRSKKIW